MSQSDDYELDPVDSVFLDATGQSADKKFEFEISRHVLGRTVQGVQYCAWQELDPGDPVTTIDIAFTDGGQMTVAVRPDGTVAIWIKDDSKSQPMLSLRIM